MAPRKKPWSFLEDRDKKKITKAGFATPRGGDKNAYQNHVSRSNRVIVPWERLVDVEPSQYGHGYVVRVLPEQCFEGPGRLSPDLAAAGVSVGQNAFVLYRTRESFGELPPLDDWEPRGLEKNGEIVTNRGSGAIDTGEYVLRFSNPTEKLGPPQGIFAPEYASEWDNELSQAVLAWLICQSIDAPYASNEAEALARYISQIDETLLDPERLTHESILRGGTTVCPLCGREVRYSEFHQTLDLSDAFGLANAGLQVEGATRSTIINLFHLKPLIYDSELHHRPDSVAWGHAICNTLLGQRRCIPLAELVESGMELKPVDRSRTYASRDGQMIRTEGGGVWIRLVEGGHAIRPLSDEASPEMIEEEDAGG